MEQHHWLVKVYIFSTEISPMDSHKQIKTRFSGVPSDYTLSLIVQVWCSWVISDCEQLDLQMWQTQCYNSAYIPWWLIRHSYKTLIRDCVITAHELRTTYKCACFVFPYLSLDKVVFDGLVAKCLVHPTCEQNFVIWNHGRVDKIFISLVHMFLFRSYSKCSGWSIKYHYEDIPIQYIENFTFKNWKISDEKLKYVSYVC